MTAIADAVVEREDGWGFQCPRGGDGSCAPFVSTGWPTKKSATARLAEHLAEHDEGDAAISEGRDVDRSKLMSSLEDFRAKHGLTVNADGSVSA